MATVFKIDSMEFPHIHCTGLTRSFSVLDGSNSGRLQTGAMVRDVIGTYYNYKLEIDAEDNSIGRGEYDTLYEILSSPQDSHLIEVPYGQDKIQFRAYITSGEDSIEYMNGNYVRWGATSLSFVAMNPRRIPE